GHLEVLQWTRNNGCPWDETTCEYAARNGHLEVLQWAHNTGCPWDEATCSKAALNGHVEVLLWARKNGCPWSSDKPPICASRFVCSDGDAGEDDEDGNEYDASQPRSAGCSSSNDEEDEG
ncbi:unnamed protein product, partial [Ectocarpus fasciculatus]